MPLPVLRERRHEGVASRLVVKKTEHATFAAPSKASTPLIQGGPENRTTQGWFEDLARGRFIIGDKASVYADFARYREPSNAAAELGLRRFAHGKPGRAPPSVGYDDTAKLAQPAARVLDPHRILPYCVSRQQKQLSYLIAIVQAQRQERKSSRRPGGIKDAERLQGHRHRHPCEPELRHARQIPRSRRSFACRRAPALRAHQRLSGRDGHAPPDRRSLSLRPLSRRSAS